jgi:hypothetical protein
MGHTGLPRKSNQRKHVRDDVSGKLRILWTDEDGSEKLALAEVVNVSSFGLQLRVDSKLSRGTTVLCNDRELGVSGRGSVRYCNFAKGKYVVGLEFSSGTGWKPAAAKITQAS